MQPESDLATEFIAALAPSVRHIYEAQSDLSVQLQTVLSVAKARHQLSLPVSVFLSFLARRVSPTNVLESLHIEDLFLACACTAHIPRAAETLVQTHRAALEKRLLPEFESAAVLDDTLQIVLTNVLMGTDSHGPSLLDYSGRGSLRNWLTVAALRVAIDLSRNAITHKSVLGLEEILDIQIDNSDPDLAHLQGRVEIKNALREAINSLPPKVKTVLRLNTLEGLNIEEIGQMYGVHRSTVARWIAQGRTQLLADVRERLMTHLRLSATELDSLLRLADDRLELSFSDARAGYTESFE